MAGGKSLSALLLAVLAPGWIVLSQGAWGGTPPAAPSPPPAAPARAPSPVPSAQPSPPAIESLVKPKHSKRLIDDRDILYGASLEDMPDKKRDGQRYAFYATMLVRSDFARTRRILTDYKVYSEIVPYVDKTTYSPITRELDVQGGIWKWRLRSQIRFDEIGDGWIRYTIVGGHFRGLQGDMLFESRGEKGTLVYLRGELTAKTWIPPKFVLERGAEIVFGFTANRMRKYVESKEDEPVAPPPSAAHPPANQHDGQNLPKPRSRL